MRYQAALASISAALALFGGPACSRPAGDAAAGASASPSAAAPGASWSREALAPRQGGAEPLDPAVIGSVESDALDDLVAAAPKLVVSPTVADGGTVIGADSGVPPADASAIEPRAPEAKPSPSVVVGALVLQAEAASPAIERAARAQLYWNLVQRCRDKEGKILPADAITIQFNLDTEGFIVPSSILATPSAEAYAEAAHCVRRELSTATFRAPAATWGRSDQVKATLPSVD